MVTGTFPSLWKSGKVSALFKKGDRFRPKQLQANNSVTYAEEDSGEGGT